MQRTVLLSQFCPSVRLSVRPYVRCVYCDKTKQRTANILISHETVITLVFWHQHSLVRDASFPVKYSPKVTPFEKGRLRLISGHNVSSVTGSEKRSITTNRKSTTGFPTIYRWSTCVRYPLVPKGWLKKRFLFFWIKFNFNRIQSDAKFLCVKTSSSKVVA